MWGWKGKSVPLKEASLSLSPFQIVLFLSVSSEGMSSTDEVVDALRREAHEWRTRCEQAGVLGKQLVAAKQRLEGENAELQGQVRRG